MVVGIIMLGHCCYYQADDLIEHAQWVGVSVGMLSIGRGLLSMPSEGGVGAPDESMVNSLQWELLSMFSEISR